MQLCYLDESGDLGALPSPPGPNDQPVFVLAGLLLDAGKLEAFTNDFLGIKYRYFPNLAYPRANHLSRIVPEIKGSDLRSDMTRKTPAEQRQAFGFLDRIMDLLERNEAKVIARILVKGVGAPFDATAVYSSCTQILCSHFDHYLEHEVHDLGFCIADGRNKPKNVNVAHSIFTKKFQAATSVYSRLLELPTFGHSDNHAGLQVCDLLCSALMYPIACEVYCTGHVANVHVQPNAAAIRARYGQRLKHLQYRYADPTSGKYKGGIVVADGIGAQSAGKMFV